ncbi:hypothetical protein [Bacillus sp. AFS073361]|uniref:DUF6944 family repetitive protein n=1 Tax=Bacillus sp. AFS073361 TaxID=2033511 RepID=UPI00359C8BD1
MGGWLQAAGNPSNAVGVDIEISGSEEEGTVIDALGSGIQGLGAAFEETKRTFNPKLD